MSVPHVIRATDHWMEAHQPSATSATGAGQALTSPAMSDAHPSGGHDAVASAPSAQFERPLLPVLLGRGSAELSSSSSRYGHH
jgi:hypothetical protein